MPDASIASSRAEGALDVSGAGAAELARRSATAVVEPTNNLAAPKSGQNR